MYCMKYLDYIIFQKLYFIIFNYFTISDILKKNNNKNIIIKFKKNFFNI